jgi:hypothetical protein
VGFTEPTAHIEEFWRDFARMENIDHDYPGLHNVQGVPQRLFVEQSCRVPHRFTRVNGYVWGALSRQRMQATEPYPDSFERIHGSAQRITPAQNDLLEFASAFFQVVENTVDIIDLHYSRHQVLLLQITESAKT